MDSCPTIWGRKWSISGHHSLVATEAGLKERLRHQLFSNVWLGGGRKFQYEQVFINRFHSALTVHHTSITSYLDHAEPWGYRHCIGQTTTTAWTTRYCNLLATACRLDGTIQYANTIVNNVTQHQLLHNE